MRSGDAEAAPDADGLRPCGLALLRALLNRGGEPVAQELVQLAARLQARGALKHFWKPRLWVSGSG